MFTPEDRKKALAARKARPTRAEQMAAFPTTFEKLRAQSPRMALPIIAQAEAGSMPAAVKLLCLDCSGWQRREVRDCAIVGCPMYPHRPYQRAEGKNPNDP
jgi:hypothetical protein